MSEYKTKKAKKILIYPRICPWYFDEIMNGTDPNLSGDEISIVTDEFFTSKYKDYKGVKEVLFYPSSGRKKRLLKLFSLLNYIRKQNYEKTVILTSNTKRDHFSMAMLFFIFFPVIEKYEYNLLRDLHRLSFKLIIKSVFYYTYRVVFSIFDSILASILLFLLASSVMIVKIVKKSIRCLSLKR